MTEMFGHYAGATVLVAGIVVLTAATGGAVLGDTVGQSGPTIGFSGVEDVAVDDTDSARIRFAGVNDSDGVGSFTVNVTYDPDAVSVNASGAGAFSVATATPEPGVLRVTGYTGRYPGPNGSGSLFSLSVMGESASDAVTLSLAMGTFTDADGNDISVSTGSATLAVEATASGDTGDGGDGGGGGGQPGGGADGEVELTDRALLNDTVSTGEPVVARADLANFDPADGQFTLTLTADGSTVAERTVTVRASSRRTVDLSTRFGSPGTYALLLNGQAIGEVTVEAAASPSPTATQVPGTSTPGLTETSPPTTSPAGTPEPSTSTETATELPTTTGDGTGLGVVATLVAVGLVLLVARRRRY